MVVRGWGARDTVRVGNGDQRQLGAFDVGPLGWPSWVVDEGLLGARAGCGGITGSVGPPLDADPVASCQVHLGRDHRGGRDGAELGEHQPRPSE